MIDHRRGDDSGRGGGGGPRLRPDLRRARSNYPDIRWRIWYTADPSRLAVILGIIAQTEPIQAESLRGAGRQAMILYYLLQIRRLLLGSLFIR